MALRRFPTFRALFCSDLFPKTGFGAVTPEEAAQGMYRYYTKEQEQAFGVLGIEISCEGEEA